METSIVNSFSQVRMASKLYVLKTQVVSMFNRSATITVVGAGSDGRPVFTVYTRAYYFHYYNNLTKIFSKPLINFFYNITKNYYSKNYSIIKLNTNNFALNRF